LGQLFPRRERLGIFVVMESVVTFTAIWMRRLRGHKTHFDKIDKKLREQLIWLCLMLLLGTEMPAVVMNV
jgi:uncharacterized membrane protein YdjX (TVP38/TMEM64 family)